MNGEQEEETMARLKSLFDDLTVEHIMKAFDHACAAAEEPLSPETRELVAKRIIGTAALGECDPRKMSDDAISYISS